MSQSSGLTRPKPWEKKSALEPIGESELPNNEAISSSTPDLPTKPSGLESGIDTNINGLGTMRTAYGGYNSPYGSSMYGGMGSMYGGMGSMYGGMGSMYGGMGSMYGGGLGSMYGMNGMNGMNGNSPGLAESTQATFQLIEGLIGAVAGFAQMLEATYMATHNSFFTMISVAEQFQYIKEMLGSFFGIFALIKFVKKILYRVTGGKMGLAPNPKRIESISTGGDVLSRKFVEEFTKGGLEASKKSRKISWKPLIVFLTAVFGFPYLLNKFINMLQQNRRLKVNNMLGQEQIDLNNLEFARAMYDFVPENPRIECALKKGDLMAILSTTDPMGNKSEWWKVRTKQGNIGYVPYNYIELIKKRKSTTKQNVTNENSTNLISNENH